MALDIPPVVENQTPPVEVRDISHESLIDLTPQLYQASLKLGLHPVLPASHVTSSYRPPAQLREPAYMRGSHAPFVPGSLATDLAPRKFSPTVVSHFTQGHVNNNTLDLVRAEISQLFNSFTNESSIDSLAKVEPTGFELSSEQEAQLLGLRQMYPQDGNSDLNLGMHYK